MRRSSPPIGAVRRSLARVIGVAALTAALPFCARRAPTNVPLDHPTPPPPPDSIAALALSPAFGPHAFVSAPGPSRWSATHEVAFLEFVTREFVRNESRLGESWLDLAPGGDASACVSDRRRQSGTRSLYGGGRRADGTPGTARWSNDDTLTLGLAGRWSAHAGHLAVTLTPQGSRCQHHEPRVAEGPTSFTLDCALATPAQGNFRVATPALVCRSVGDSPEGWQRAAVPMGAPGVEPGGRDLSVRGRERVWVLGASPGVVVRWNLLGRSMTPDFSVRPGGVRGVGHDR